MINAQCLLAKAVIPKLKIMIKQLRDEHPGPMQRLFKIIIRLVLKIKMASF